MLDLELEKAVSRAVHEGTVKLVLSAPTRERRAAPPAVRGQHNRQKNYLLPQGEGHSRSGGHGGYSPRRGAWPPRCTTNTGKSTALSSWWDDALSALPDRGDRPLRCWTSGVGNPTSPLCFTTISQGFETCRCAWWGWTSSRMSLLDATRRRRRYGYDGLHFELGDINGYEIDCPVDMVVTLHACDTATDHALFHAVRWGVPLILSVPCCQHEVNGQISAQKLSLLTRYGIVKERFSALLTDAIRANLLVCCGYKAQLLEFVDFAHTPKNLLIRAVRGNVSQEARERALKEAQACLDEFGIWPALPRLLQEAELVRGLERPRHPRHPL